jgi:type I restriction enzyme M protein
MIENKENGANLGFEKKLWIAADKMRSNMDAAEYKHVVLGLIFLKYISDAFEEQAKKLDEAEADSKSEWYVKSPVDRGYLKGEREAYTKNNIFWVPEKARWKIIEEHAKKPEIGKIIDEAMDEIEKENPKLKGVLPKDYSRPALDKQKLGQLIDLIGTIGLGNKENRSKDVLGRVYEYFLGQFADAEGKKGGQFYTPRCIVELLVKMIEPYEGRVFDPCCGSGGMFVQSEKFVEEHGGRKNDIYVYGQESNPTTWKLCNMNLAIRGIDCDIKLGDSFQEDQHKDLRADYILANPPFNMSDWGGEFLRDDVRWKYGVPPTGNANFAWVQHFIHHLAPHGIAGFVLANGSMSSNTSNEGEIRKNILEADLVDCMVALPSQLFYNTMIPCCLWFLTKDKTDHGKRKRKGEVLFIDARNMGSMIDRRHRELTKEDINKIVNTYHAWRGEKGVGNYEDTLGFCNSAKLKDLEKHNFILTPGRYVGIPEEDEDPEVFEEKMKRLTKELKEQIEEGKKLDEEIKRNLGKIGWDV